MRRWLTTRQVAALCGVARSTVNRWCQNGKLVARRRVTHWQIDADDAERMAREQGRSDYDMRQTEQGAV